MEEHKYEPAMNRVEEGQLTESLGDPLLGRREQEKEEDSPSSPRTFAKIRPIWDSGEGALGRKHD